MQEVIEKLKELIEMLEEPEQHWLDKLPEKHRKFAAYWDELGRPEMQCKLIRFNTWCETSAPRWDESIDYRIKDDMHWELRLKWVNSDKTLPIEKSDYYSEKWIKDNDPVFDSFFRYREANPWYEQEISIDKPILLRQKDKDNIIWYSDIRPNDYENWTPLTDAEIEAFKRGF